MRTNKCKHNKRECKVEGCTSTEFYDTCNNMCKTHRAEYGLRMYHERKKRKDELFRQKLKTSCRTSITITDPDVPKKLTLRF
jgi:hypothetical protein